MVIWKYENQTGLFKIIFQTGSERELCYAFLFGYARLSFWEKGLL